MENGNTSIAERVDLFPEPWMPAVGDKLVGRVVGLSERDSDYGEPYVIVCVRCEDGSTQDSKPIPEDTERDFHAFHTVARNELGKLRPRVDDRVAIKYFGKHEQGGYERYRIVVEHAEMPEAPVDWNRQAAIAEASEDTDTGTATSADEPPDDLPMGPADAPA